MSSLQLTIPAQSQERSAVKIKPREVKAWLDDLPFLDLQKTARLTREQLRVMNRQPLGAATRLEMLGHFLATYQRLAESTGSHGTDGDTLRPLVKRLCQDIGFGYKIVVHELVNKRSGFIETRSLPLALLGAIHTLGLQLYDCYSNYQRAPRSLWGECLALYGYAWQSGRETFSAELPGFGKQQIDENFRLGALLHLADPYRLPAGMVPALGSYFARRIGLTGIHGEPPEDKNCFQLREAFQQSPDDQDPHLYLELDNLLQQMQADCARLEQVKQAGALGLGPEVPFLPLLQSLRQIINHWLYHPNRTAEREETHTRIDLVNGLNAVYCMVNKGRCFDPAMFLSGSDENVIDLSDYPAPERRGSQSLPVPFSCTSVNRSLGGLAVRYNGGQQPHPKVGQLIALRRPGTQSGAGWVVAVCRWLVELENGQGFELGLQYIAREPRVVVVRGSEEPGRFGDYQPALAAIQKRGHQTVSTLILNGGNLKKGAQLMLIDGGKQTLITCHEALESGPGFQRLIYFPTENGT